jgi:flavin reductase (DIM6/NTAB) family NADH-FMN oxidoreductase RutF
VKAPLIAEGHANFECRLVDSSLVSKCSFFIFEVAAARVARAPKFPKTIHYRGSDLFMLSGQTVSRYLKLFDPDRLKAEPRRRRSAD